jgi:hypothetical protein
MKSAHAALLDDAQAFVPTNITIKEEDGYIERLPSDDLPE